MNKIALIGIIVAVVIFALIILASVPPSVPPEAFCGDGICQTNEDYQNCPQDCKQEWFCGDGTCQTNETYQTCPQDCKQICNPHASFSCYSNDVYWFDSCNQREEKKQECGEPSSSPWSNFCFNNDVHKKRILYQKGCSGSTCFSGQQEEKIRVEDCGESYYTPWSNTCYNNNVYKERIYYEKGCSGSSCFSTQRTERTQVENCLYGCTADPQPRCKTHKAEIQSLQAPSAKKGAIFEDVKNYAYILVNNTGDFDETLTVSFANSTRTVTISKRTNQNVVIEWEAGRHGTLTLKAIVSNSFISLSKTIQVVVTETEWHYYLKFKPADYLRYTRATTNCDKDSSIIKNRAESLTLSTPRGTAENYLNWIYSSIPYDIEMYNNIIVNGLDWFYGTPKASTTIQRGKGICRHQAQLFVSLARARGMPARVVYVWAEGCNPFDFLCYGLNFLHTLGLASYNHSIAQVWMIDHWEYVDATSGEYLGTALPYYYKNPTLNIPSPWHC